jgi:hypothetical protein
MYNGNNEGLDTITDFTLGAGGDRLELADVLSNFTATSKVQDYVRLSGGAGTLVSVKADGTGNDFVSLVTLQNIAFSDTLLNDMLANGNLLLLG